MSKPQMRERLAFWMTVAIGATSVFLMVLEQI